MPQQEQEPQPHRKAPPAGWRYYAQAKHRSRLRGWLAQVWREAKNNAALVSLFGVLLTLLVTTVLAQQEQVRQQRLENQRAEAAREVAEQQAQDEALQTYLGDMGELILRDSSPLPEASPDDAVSRLARAKTLAALVRLDPSRKSGLLQFLVEAQLIQRVEKRAPIITLGGADLSGANLSGADLRGANLREANLSGAYLREARGVTKEQLEKQTENLKGANHAQRIEAPLIPTPPPAYSLAQEADAVLRSAAPIEPMHERWGRRILRSSYAGFCIGLVL